MSAAVFICARKDTLLFFNGIVTANVTICKACDNHHYNWED